LFIIFLIKNASYLLENLLPKRRITVAFSCGRRGTAARFPETSLSSFGGLAIAVDEEFLKVASCKQI